MGSRVKKIGRGLELRHLEVIRRLRCRFPRRSGCSFPGPLRLASQSDRRSQRKDRTPLWAEYLGQPERRAPCKAYECARPRFPRSRGSSGSIRRVREARTSVGRVAIDRGSRIGTRIDYSRCFSDRANGRFRYGTRASTGCEPGVVRHLRKPKQRQVARSDGPP